MTSKEGCLYLSNDEAAFPIADWLLFMRFLGMGLSDKASGATTIWPSWTCSPRQGAIAKLFAVFEALSVRVMRPARRPQRFVRGSKSGDVTIVYQFLIRSYKTIINRYP